MTQYELVNSIYTGNLEQITKLISNSKFKRTFTVIINFVSKIEDLKQGLETLEKKQSFYSSQCLARVLTEHFLVVFYIWNKARTDETDECASDYLDYYPIYEMMKRDNFNSKLDKSYDPRKTPLENFFVKAPEFKDEISEADFLDINTRANKFDVRNILKFMQDDLKIDDAFKPVEKIVLSDCMKYNEISTYVHAGRLAEKQTFENTPPTDKAKVMKDNVQMAEIYSCQTLSFLMLLLILENPDFIKIYQPVIDFISTK